MEALRKEIEERAYDMYEARQQWGIPGDALSDWLQAEKEVKFLYKKYELTESIGGGINGTW